MTRRNEDRSRGAVIVESVIVITVILTLFFGVIEFGMLLRSRHALAEASRTGARSASSLSRVDGYQTITAESVAASLRGSIPNNAVLQLIIYRADPNTGQPAVGSLPNCGDCYRFTWDSVTESFVPLGGYAWLYSDQKACGDVGNTDHVAVKVFGEYDFVSTFWSDRVDLTDTTVMRLEPITDSSSCS